MDTPISTCFARINHTLEHVVMPEISSAFIRGQVYSAMDLLNQLEPRIEYRRDLLTQEITEGTALLTALRAALTQAGVDIPGAVADAVCPPDLGALTSARLHKERDTIDAAVSAALDLVHAHRAEIPEIAAIERDALTRIQKLIARNMGLVRPLRLEKISRGGTKEAPDAGD